MNRQPVTCPACGEREGVPIVWGLVVPDESDRTDVSFGGCAIPADPPTTRCRSCGHAWGRHDTERSPGG